MITSVSNKQMKNLMKLQKSSRTRREQGLFIIEGIRMFEEVPKDRLDQVYVTEAFYEKNRGLFEKRRPDAFLAENVMEKISETKTPQGVLATVKMQEYEVADLLKENQDPLFLVLENLQDPGNLGTILRTGEGAGVDGIIMSRDTVDIYNPKVVRSTMGALFRMPFCYVADLEGTIGQLKERNIRIYAAHLEGDGFYEKDYRSGCAFLIGNEGNGLSDSITSLADEKIRIPMKGKVESLNAAIAATLMVYEALRQRL
ncbi:MAG: RNA methyltransferase [Lachnospiraceae bacterium]|nr:RNA methyltransferase [Lachnospiraceae bacterium]